MELVGNVTIICAVITAIYYLSKIHKELVETKVREEKRHSEHERRLDMLEKQFSTMQGQMAIYLNTANDLHSTIATIMDRLTMPAPERRSGRVRSTNRTTS